MEEARDHIEYYETDLPLNRQVEVTATRFGKKEKEVIGYASAMLGQRWRDDEAEDPETPGEFFPETRTFGMLRNLLQLT
jgi:hypothetical protein